MTPKEVQQLTELTQQQSLIMDTVPIQMWFLTDAETYSLKTISPNIRRHSFPMGSAPIV